MSRIVLLHSMLLATLVVLSPPSAAQPVSGDLVVADSYNRTLGRVYSRAPAGQLTTIYSGFSGFFPNWISMAADNVQMYVPFVDANTYTSGLLSHISPNGLLALLRNIGQDIRFSNGQEPYSTSGFINAGNQGALFLFDPTTLNLTTLTSLPPALNEVAVDRQNGGILGAIYAPTVPSLVGSLLEFDVGTSSITTLLNTSLAISRPTGLVFDPATGDYILARIDAPGLIRIDRTTLGITTLWTGSPASALALSPRNTFYMATRTDVREFDGSGTIVNTFTFPVQIELMGVAEYADRRVSVSGTPVPGGTVTIDVMPGKPSDAGRSYALAMSLSTYPDAVGPFPNGEVMNLAADPLFFVTASDALPTIFVNFRGVLDSQARAQAQINIPVTTPSTLNLPLNVGGIVIDPSVPGSVSTVLTSVTFVLR
jgi:hypothetical protein